MHPQNDPKNARRPAGDWATGGHIGTFIQTLTGGEPDKAINPDGGKP